MSKIYLSSTKLLDDKYCLKKDLIIDFKTITLLVGDQGCGKSTLLNLLQSKSELLKLNLSEETIKKGVDTFYFDSEKMNPRILGIDDFSNPDGTSKGIGVGVALSTRFKSHGEILQVYTVNAITKAENCIVFLDEPESSLSLRNQFKLAKNLKKATERNVQFIIATHCLPLIESVKYVYSLEHLKWMKSLEFINLNK